MKNKASIYLHGPVLKEITSRGQSVSGVINRDLGRLYGLYRRALLEIGLTVEEALFVTDVVKDLSVTPDVVRFLWAHVSDACIYRQLDKKWGVDGASLVEKLKKMDDLRLMAIVDAAERLLKLRKEEGQETQETTAVREIFYCR